ncbi:MAG: alanyl-tRNA editing protein [Alphaproteobacteria bacterium]
MTEELFRADSYLKSCEAKVMAVDEVGIRLDRTVFYPEGGGQPGDSGTLSTADGRSIRITTTRKHPGTGGPSHVPEAGAPVLAVGDSVRAEIDWARRHAHMRMHSCLHLLCSLVEGAVTGGGLSETKGRLDFDLPGEVPNKERLTAELNRLIREDHPVVPRWITDEELAANPDLVRTMSVKPPTGSGRVRLLEIAGVDLQPCGGTHVARTGEIGAVVITKIENKGRQNRRFNIAFAP